MGGSLDRGSPVLPDAGAAATSPPAGTTAPVGSSPPAVAAAPSAVSDPPEPPLFFPAEPPGYPLNLADLPEFKVLTPRYREFISHFLTEFNGTQAALKVGIKPGKGNGNAAVWATNALRDPKVGPALLAALRVRMARTGLTQDYVIGRLVALAEHCMTPKVMTSGSEPRMDSVGAGRALEILARHLGMLWDQKRFEVTQDIRIIEVRLPAKAREREELDGAAEAVQVPTRPVFALPAPQGDELPLAVGEPPPEAT